ncbi:NAD-dependent epimerase/dehydratase family protein [Henriciella aquimarina]|uniref:NAD-dependent epimerase/dehydratase family protein n=1 Tax=Henriciella aquimarina TaxID=545261 RepID=UPI001301B602|nr:NAD-dependent epimerase/dehydratase family protein [Henriciella aquimarina]
MPTIAITGATGFAGSHLVPHLRESNLDWQLKCLARPRPGRQLEDHAKLNWIPGSVGSAEAIDALVKDAATVIHAAGLTRATGADAFHSTNTRATAALVTAARRAGAQHFILISSLAASRPEVSPYAWSKALAEQAATALAGDMRLTIVRPPAILGPGDSATRDSMAMLRRGWLIHPGSRPSGSTFSWIDVNDLARFITGIAASPTSEAVATLAPCSGQDISWDEVATAAEKALERKVRRIAIPPAAVKTIGFLASGIAQLTRKPLILSAGKARELLQPDWHADVRVSAPTPLHRTLSGCFLSHAEHDTSPGADFSGH